MPDNTLAVLVLVAAFSLGMATVALFLRNIIHCALLLIASWLGVAAFYLWAGAEFAAFAQVLVYVGAVAMVVIFAVLLTRREEQSAPMWLNRVSLLRQALALSAASLVAAVLIVAIAGTPFGLGEGGDSAVFPVRQIGVWLLEVHAGALLVSGVLLTVALLGAVVIASPEKDENKEM